MVTTIKGEAKVGGWTALEPLDGERLAPLTTDQIKLLLTLDGPGKTEYPMAQVGADGIAVSTNGHWARVAYDTKIGAGIYSFPALKLALRSKAANWYADGRAEGVLKSGQPWQTTPPTRFMPPVLEAIDRARAERGTIETVQVLDWIEDFNTAVDALAPMKVKPSWRFALDGARRMILDASDEVIWQGSGVDHGRRLAIACEYVIPIDSGCYLEISKDPNDAVLVRDRQDLAVQATMPVRVNWSEINNGGVK